MAGKGGRRPRRGTASGAPVAVRVAGPMGVCLDRGADRRGGAPVAGDAAAACRRSDPLLCSGRTLRRAPGVWRLAEAGAWTEERIGETTRRCPLAVRRRVAGRIRCCVRGKGLRAWPAGAEEGRGEVRPRAHPWPCVWLDRCACAWTEERIGGTTRRGRAAVRRRVAGRIRCCVRGEPAAAGGWRRGDGAAGRGGGGRGRDRVCLDRCACAWTEERIGGAARRFLGPLRRRVAGRIRCCVRVRKCAVPGPCTGGSRVKHAGALRRGRDGPGAPRSRGRRETGSTRGGPARSRRVRRAVRTRHLTSGPPRPRRRRHARCPLARAP